MIKEELSYKLTKDVTMYNLYEFIVENLSFEKVIELYRLLDIHIKFLEKSDKE